MPLTNEQKQYIIDTAIMFDRAATLEPKAYQDLHQRLVTIGKLAHQDLADFLRSDECVSVRHAWARGV